MDRKIDSIIIHVADTREDDPTTTKNEEMDIGAKEIEQWHKERAESGEPWSPYKDSEGQSRFIGYHYVVRRDGSVERGRPVAIPGCHCKGHNAHTIAVVWVGRKFMTLKQKISLPKLVAKLAVSHGLTENDIDPHCKYSDKTCPNFTSKDTFESIEHFQEKVAEQIRILK